MAQYTTTNAPLPYVQPYLQDYLSKAQDVSNQGYTQGPGTYTGPNNLLNTGWQAVANRATQGSPEMSAARTQLGNTINGNFLNANPYLQNQVQQAQGDLAQSYNQVQAPAWDKAMQSSGSFGNTGVMQAQGQAQDMLQRNMGRVASDMYGNAYNTERGYQQQAIGMAPSFAASDYNDANQLLSAGNQMQGFQQAQQNQNQAWYDQAQQYPIQRLNVMGNALGIGSTGGTSTQNSPDVSTASSALGGALTGAQLGSLFGQAGWGAGLGGLLGLFGG